MENQSVVQLLNKVMNDVGAISKSDRNQSQGFNFRGIDAVVNAVSPALQKHGIIVVPTVEHSEYQTVEIGKNRTAMGHCRVKVSYSFIGPNGDAVKATVIAEAMDSGDKASAKAMSVAFRTALLQSLCLPTDEIDPDASSYERSEVKIEPVDEILSKISKVKNLDALAYIGQYITAHKDAYDPKDLEAMREAFKVAQSWLVPKNEGVSDVATNA